MEPALRKLQLSYIEVETGILKSAFALSAGANEAQEIGYAIFVVNNKEMIVPTLDEQNRLVSWTTVGFQRIDSDPGINTTLYEFKTQESYLENLVGMNVGG